MLAVYPRVILSENFDQATLPTTLPLNATLPNSFGFYSTTAKVELVESATESFGGTGRSLKATYPSITGDQALYPWSGFDLTPYNTDRVYLRFRAKMPKGKHGMKFVKVFGQRTDTTGYANTTFGLDYTGVDAGCLYAVSYGDGTDLENDTAQLVFLDGGGYFGRATGLPGLSVSTPQQKIFRSSDWGTDWHLFEFYVKFNSSDSTATEINDGEIMVRIDGKTYIDAKGLYNRNAKNMRLDRVEILGWMQTAGGATTPEVEIWYDNIEISLDGWNTTLTPSAPVITTQPIGQTVATGSPATLTVVTSGDPTPTCQWYFNGAPISGATSASYTVSTVTEDNSGTYTVVATNGVGTATSNAAVVNSIPAGFDVAGYYARNADVAANFGSDSHGAWQHYGNWGLAEGRQYDAQFIVGEYLLLNTDLTSAFGSDLQAALMHWLTYGKPVEDRIGRVPIGFNVDAYLARYPDLAAAFGAITPTATRNVTVWNHYLDWGVREGRSDGDFEAYNYLATNADLAAVFGTDVEAAALHWYFYGRREGRRIPVNFSVTGYRSRNPDIVTVWGNDKYGCWLHYRDVGVYENRVFDDLFRVIEYRARYADVQAAYGSDLTGVLNHWLFYGKPEGRLGRNP